MTRARRLPLRTRIFVGCEGQSEVEYAGLIQNLCEVGRLPVHLVIENLHPKGDPLGRVEKAIWKIERGERNREAFAHRFVLMDRDQVDCDPQRASQVETLAHRHEIKLIWQRPCHEALLLRHFVGHHNDGPQTSQLAQQALTSVWPEYRKPMEKRDLVRIIDLAAFRRALAVEDDLRHFAECLGFMEA